MRIESPASRMIALHGRRQYRNVLGRYHAPPTLTDEEREANARRDGLHKVALDIVRRYDVLALERLAVRSMVRSARGTVDEPGKNVRAKAGLNRSLLDAGFGILATLIREKAEYAARVVVRARRRTAAPGLCRLHAQRFHSETGEGAG